MYIVSLMSIIATIGALTDEEISARLEQTRIYYRSTASVGWVANQHGMCAKGSAGFAQILDEAPVFNAEGRLNMGSLTKSMTCVVVAILLTQNKITGQVPVEYDSTSGNFG